MKITKIKIALILGTLLIFFLIIEVSGESIKNGIETHTYNIREFNFDTGSCTDIIRDTWENKGNTSGEISVSNGIFYRMGDFSDLKSILMVNSSIGLLNYSIINDSGTNLILVKPFVFQLNANSTSFVELRSMAQNCITQRPAWSLIRLPFLKVDDYSAQYIININRKLGQNKDGYIFLLGIPYPSNSSFLSSNLISTDPISVSFDPTSTSYNSTNLYYVNAFLDLYYFSNPLLKIKQTDTINLEESTLIRSIQPRNFDVEDVYYTLSGNTMNLFHEKVADATKIPANDSSYEPPAIFPKVDLYLNKTSCSWLGKDNLHLYPFRCVLANGEIIASNYIQSDTTELPIDFIYTLEFSKLDNNLEIVNPPNRCISYNQIYLPPIQVVGDVQQLAMQVSLPKTTTCDNRIIINHDNIAEYISPQLINSTSNFSKLKNSFNPTEYSISVPDSSISIDFQAKYNNPLFPKVLSWFYLFLYSFFGFIYAREISIKRRRKNENKVDRLIFFISLVLTIFLEILSIATLNPNNMVITILTILPLFGLLLGIILFLVGYYFIKKTR